MKFNAFSSFGMFKFSAAPTRAETIYRSMYASKVKAFDMTKGGYQEAKTYAQAMGIARARYTLERALNQADPLKAIELLPKLEQDWAVVPNETHTVRERQIAVALRMLLSRGARREFIEAGLHTILGNDFIAVRTMVPTEVEYYAPSDASFTRPDLPFKVIRLKTPVLQVGVSYEVEYENADLTAGPLLIAVGDVLTVEVENTNTIEVVTVLSATATSFTAVFAYSHDVGAFATTQNLVNWFSSQRHIFVVVKQAASRDAEIVRRVNDFMTSVCRAVTTWDIVEPTTPGAWTFGPFQLNTSALGTQTIEQMNVFEAVTGTPTAIAKPPAPAVDVPTIYGISPVATFPGGIVLVYGSHLASGNVYIDNLWPITVTHDFGSYVRGTVDMMATSGTYPLRPNGPLSTPSAVSLTVL